MEKIKLKSKTDKVFEIPRVAAQMSILIKNMLEATSETDEPVPLSNISSDTLEKVVEYCIHYQNELPKPIQKPLKKFEDAVSQWDLEFIDLDKSRIFELMNAANYLHIESLLNLTCAKIASMIANKSAEEIRVMFDIVNDFTPEEEAQVREENRWCEDI